jgi:serine phosphatase RsbU (regulator of sigma subunit)/ABC-type amino acid transport substrate-binding protein
MVLAGQAFSQLDSPESKPSIILTLEEQQWLAKHKVIRVAPDPDFPPFEFFDNTGTYRGIAADYLTLLEERLDIEFQIVREESWLAVLAKAKKREIDILGAAMRTPQRSEYLSFTAPHIRLPSVIIATTDSRETLTLEQLRGKKVAVVSGYVWHDLLETDHPDIELVPVPNISAALQMTSFKIVDATVGDQATTTYFIGKEGLATLRLAGKSGYQLDLAIAIRKDWPHLNSILDKALAMITPQERAQISHKWIQLRHVPLWRKREFWISLGAAVGAVLLVIAAILVWNRALSRKVAQRTAALNSELTWRKQAEEELRQHRDHLDNLVRIRTAELTVANERMKRDLEAAAQLQQSLLPQSAPEVKGARFAWHYRPCDELAGDILNVFQLDKTHVGIYVVDVSGHGIAASLLSVAISRALTPTPSKSSLVVRHGDNSSDLRIVPPVEVAMELNRRFPMEDSGGKYFTMVYGIVDIEAREFRYVSAGHPPVVYAGTGAKPQVLKAGNLAIGWFPEAKFEESFRHLKMGDRLFIYSDGVPEASNPDHKHFGSHQLIQVLAETNTCPLDASVDRLVNKLETWCSSTGPKDDVSIVAVEIM